MAEPITMQKLIDASMDSDSLEALVNGDENTQVTSRLGESYPSVQKAIKLMTQAGVGFSPFELKTEMTGSELVDGNYAIVTNDTTENNGLYKNKSGAWSKVTWDIDERQKTYTDTAKQDAISSAGTMIVDYDKSIDAITVNAGKNYPFKPLIRDGIMSEKDAVGDTKSLEMFLDAAVLNAEQGFYYAVSYYRNGLTGGGKSPDGWMITRHTKSTYATESDEVQIITTGDDQTPLVRDGSIQTIFLKSPTYKEIVKLTIDTSKLNPSGEYYAWNGNLRPLWSWVIDENTYILKDDNTSGTPIVTYKPTLSAELADGVLRFAYNGGASDYRVTIKPNGYNNLPNIYQVDRRTAGSTGSWLWLIGGDTDWLPPLRATVASGQASFSEITTGGNHGKDGGDGGGQTARNIYYSVEIDGKEQTTFNGSANAIKVTIINEVMAMNTVTDNRYAVRECFVIDINQYGLMTVSCDRRALEPLTMSRDRGLQALIHPFNESLLVLDGSVNTRQPVVEGGGSGLKSAAPNAHTIILHGTEGHQLSMSVDKSYGIGDGSKVADTEQLFVTTNNSTSRKAYQAMIMGTDFALAKGEGYQWRGSYQIKAIAAKPTDADSQLDTVNNRIIAYDANDYMLV